MIELTYEMRERLATALTDGYPAVVAVTTADGQPTMSYRGTVQVVGADRLGLWARNRDGALLSSIAGHPLVEVLYRHAAERIMWRFQGRARVEEDEAARTSIFDGSPQVERDRDPERAGAAVVIEVDRVFARGELAMER